MARLEPISLHPLTAEQALAAFLHVEPPRKPTKGKKKPAKGSRRAKKRKLRQ